MRLKNILLNISAFIALFVFIGCGSSENDGTTQLSIQQMLDKKDFEGVLKYFKENPSNTNSASLALASAYMLKAKLPLSSLVEILLKDDSDFASFTKEMRKRNPDSIGDTITALDQANILYKKVLGTKKCADGKNDLLSNTEEDICLLSALANIAKSSTVLSALVGDVSVLSSTAVSGKVDNKLKASTCAMEFAFTGKRNIDCTIVSQESVTFTETKKTYIPLIITVNNEAFDFLQSDKFTVVSDGFCPLNSFDARSQTKASGFYACPISKVGENEKDITSLEVLVDVLNTAINDVTAIADEDVKDEINEIKKEIADVNRDITEDDIIKYLNDRNK
jgi:hypothetical protein